SFFVSRVDTEVDKRLENMDPPASQELYGTAGLANARAAYQRFKAIFHGERFAALLEAGAPVQRPLWASTGVKNPKYPDTMYVDGLIGPETVNTMPMATLLAAAERSEIDPTHPVTADIYPSEDLKALADAGIDMTDVTDSTDAAGVRTIDDSIDIDRTLFFVSSKSGGTIEPMSMFKHFWSRKPDGSHFVAITDPGSGLADMAAEHGFRRVFLNDPDI